MCLLLGKRRRARQKTPCAFCSGVVSAWCRLLRKSDVWPIDPLTRWPFQKRTPQGQFRSPPTYTHQVWRRSVKGPRRSRGTNKQTDKCCSNYSMMMIGVLLWSDRHALSVWPLLLLLQAQGLDDCEQKLPNTLVLPNNTIPPPSQFLIYPSGSILVWSIVVQIIQDHNRNTLKTCTFSI